MSSTVSAQPAPRQREEIPAAYQWDVSPIYPDVDAWERDLQKLEVQMTAFAALKGSLSQGPQAVLDAYRRFDEIGQMQYRVYRYPQLQRDVDLRNQEVSARLQRVQTLFAKFGTATAWFTPELLTVPEATMAQWIRETPELAVYRFPILDNYRRQQHVLDERGEQLLSLATRFNQSPVAIFQELSTSDIQFPRVTFADGQEVTLSPAAYQAALQTRYLQADRARAFAAFIGVYAANRHTYAAIYHSVLNRNWFLTRARQHASTLEAALHGHAIPAAVVENLIATVRRGTAPLQRYARLRQRLLGLETYHLYDGSIPIFRTERTYPYEEAQRLVLASVAPLGSAYQEEMRTLLASGRIDVYESPGKRSGAYSAGVYGVGPYILLNYNDTLEAVFTFAHEAGHALHTVLSEQSQPFATAGYTIFVAEVASTTNERFLLDHLLQATGDPRERFLLIQHAVDAILGTFYTQVMFADFEWQAHRLVEQGRPITADVLSGIYEKLLREYWGDAVTLDENYRLNWARIPHFYNSPYYVYQYATCFASSAQIYRAMTTGDASARQAATERYLTLLRSGGDDHPMEQLRRAGVDLTQPGPVEAVIAQMEELVGQLEEEAAKLGSLSGWPAPSGKRD